MPRPGLRVGVCFGGPSVEHDVSIISAQQLMSVLDERHLPVPLYLARDGTFWTGAALRDVSSYGDGAPRGAERCELRLGSTTSPFVIPTTKRRKPDRDLAVDVVLCAIHGTGGEDGALLGALELAELPYAGGPLGPAAVAMDKARAKLTFRAAGIDVLDHVLVTRQTFADAPAQVAATVKTPCYVKPASLGSSIGVTRCADAREVQLALELALELDRTALAEPALDDAIEINAAVLGGTVGELTVSELEQPVKAEVGGLSFEDKYLRGAKSGGGKGGAAKGGGAKDSGEQGMAAADRIIPAPVSAALREQIMATAERAHRALGFAGVARYDFLVENPHSDAARVVLNEANTVPGSFAFYLFDPVGLPFVDLADRLLDIAQQEAAETRSTTRTFQSMLLARHQGSAT